MRAKFWWMLGVIVIVIGVCITAQTIVNTTLSTIDDMRLYAIKAVENGQTTEGEAMVTSMLSFISDHEPILEVFAPHDDLHDMMTELTKARVSLSINDLDDFTQAISLFYEVLNHIKTHEAIRLANIF